MPDDNPVACCLSDAELRKREATLLAQFKSALTATEELPDGYAFRIPGEKRWLALVADLIMAERECCPFLTFQLTAEPKMGALTIRMTGPDWCQGVPEVHSSVSPSARSLTFTLQEERILNLAEFRPKQRWVASIG